MAGGFFPPAPEAADAVMELIRREEVLAPGFVPEEAEGPVALSFRVWVIAGLIILISLASAFFGLDFAKVAAEGGTVFLLSVGITVGMVVSVYGALLIGAHLKELSSRFGLHHG